jgi:site-specific DNA-cytosine methylase
MQHPNSDYDCAPDSDTDSEHFRARACAPAHQRLLREYVRLLRGLQPKVLVMENVSGMVKGRMKLIFAETLRELKGSGYHVSARLMNAMYFGVPQSRERMIFIGLREDLWNRVQRTGCT